MMEPQFFQTRIGQRFYERTLPELVRQVERLADAMERSAPPELPPADSARSEPVAPPTFEPGSPVVIVENPHHADASGIVGEVVEFRPGEGVMRCDLVSVRYQRPRDGAWHVMPFGTDALDMGDRVAILERAERHEKQAAKLRAMAAGVRR